MTAAAAISATRFASWRTRARTSRACCTAACAGPLGLLEALVLGGERVAHLLEPLLQAGDLAVDGGLLLAARRQPVVGRLQFGLQARQRLPLAADLLLERP